MDRASNLRRRKLRYRNNQAWEKILGFFYLKGEYYGNQ